MLRNAIMIPMLQSHNRSRAILRSVYLQVATERLKLKTVDQVAYENGPEIAYSRILPEVRAVGLEKEVASFPAILLPRTGLSKVIFASVILIMVICVGVGTGVGIEKRMAQSQGGLSASKTTPGLLSSTISTTTTTLSTSSPTASPTIHTILNNTSIAAVTLTNGDRRFFFQDTSGAIRESLYSFAADQWETDTSNIIATDARNNTPIATFDIPSEPQGGDSDTVDNPEEIFIFYITQNSTLALRYFSQNSWYDDFTGISNFSVAAGSRSLSAAILPNAPNNAQSLVIPMNAFLVYENTDGNVSILNNHNLWSLSRLPSGSVWRDISEPLYDAYDTGEPMQSIAAAASPAGFDSLNIVLVIDSIAAPELPGAYVWSPFYNITSATWTDGTLASVRSSFVPGEIDRGIFDISQVTIFNNSDPVPYFDTIYVNGTTLRLFPTNTPGGVSELIPPLIHPPSIFPFARLGSTTELNSTAVYLYHQLNDTAFAEDKYDTVGSFWTSSTIGLSLV
ncbi:hypothetical protein MMC27_003197 [Xylographa pallens]|nr:hypothetical protein [Xylographa pallens]